MKTNAEIALDLLFFLLKDGKVQGAASQEAKANVVLALYKQLLDGINAANPH